MAGFSVLQRSVQWGQRVWKGQPLGGFTAEGTSPSSTPEVSRAVPDCRAGNRIEQGAGIGVQGLVKEGMAGGELTEVAQIHDHDTVAEVLDHAQVVGDEEVGQTLLIPEFVQELEDLCLHRYVQGGD